MREEEGQSGRVEVEERRGDGPEMSVGMFHVVSFDSLWTQYLRPFVSYSSQGEFSSSSSSGDLRSRGLVHDEPCCGWDQ